MAHIFISYSRKDKDCVDRIVTHLEDHDFPVWIDRKRIPIGADWTQELTGAIRTADIFLLVWSENSAESRYVAEEIKLAQSRNFGAKNPLQIFTVRLGNIAFPDEFTHKQAFDLDSRCSDNSIRKLIETLPTALRRFSYDKTLSEQNMEAIPDTSLVSVHYDHDVEWGFSTGIIGPRDERFLKSPKLLHVALQFTRTVDFGMINQILSSVGSNHADPIWILHIKGNVNTSKNEYELGNTKEEWEATADYIQRIIKGVATQNTVLRVFAPIPGVLLSGAMRRIDRYWHVQLYQYDKGLGGYFLAIDQPPQ